MKDNKYYYKDGTTSENNDLSKKRHRIDGPAVERADGIKAWYIDGKLHRLDGPAVEHANGAKYWYIDGKYHSEQEYRQIVKEARALSKALKLIDPRAWVRDL